MSNVKKNYIYNIIYEVLVIIIPLITSPYLSRVLGAETIGDYTYQFSIVSYFLLFARMGIVSHGSRTIAAAQNKEERSKIFWGIFTIQFILAIIVLSAYLIYLSCFASCGWDMGICMSSYLFASIFDINWYFFGREKFRITVSRNIIIKLISTLLIFVFVKQSSDIVYYAIILAVGNLFGQVIVWKYMVGDIECVKINKKLILTLIGPIVVLFIPQIAVSLYKMMDKIMLGSICAKEELAYYEYASIIVGLPLGFITSLGTVMMPRVSALLSEGKKELSKEYLHYSLLFASALSIAFTFGLIAVSPIFIPLYFGDEFLPTSTLLIGLSTTLFFLSWANVVRTQLLLPQHRDKEFIISLFSGAAINLVINYTLIPYLGAKGAVVGTIAAEIVVCLVQTLMVRNEFNAKRYILETIPFIIIGSLMLGILSVIALLPLHKLIVVGIQIIAGVLIYCILSVIYVNKLGINILEMLRSKKKNRKD